MRTRVLLLTCIVVSKFAGVHQGARAAPLAPGAPAVAPADDRLQRKAIRGHAVDYSRESPELRELREFEQSTFPRSGAAPSEGGADGRERADEPATDLGPDALPDTLKTPPAAGSPRPGPRPPSYLSSLKLPGAGPFLRFDPRVTRYLEFYKEDKRGRSIMSAWLKRQGRYRSMIEPALERHQLPRFLLYVSMIESGYDPHDRSTAGAVGLWQFLPEGARIYGLRVDYWVDQRKDPALSTEAVARYLGDLKARFGSWHLALAAFNAGYGAVLRAMQKYNTNDYWELCRHEDGLPWETLLYVPKAIATALVGENRQVFGYEDLQPDPPLLYDEVPVQRSVTLASAARLLGVPQADLERLNPELRRGRTPPVGGWTLRVPRGLGPRFAREFDPGSERLEVYTVRFGERLEDIARQRGVSLSELRRTNGVEDQSEIRAGLALLLPQKAARPADAPAPENDLLVVAVPDKSLTVPGRKRVFYRVIQGDTISAIAKFFKVTQGELARWNNLDLDATLATRMVLDIWVDKAFDTAQALLVDARRVRVVTTGSEEFFDLVETLRGRKRLYHVCKDGDTVAKVGKRYGLTAADIERINRLDKTTALSPGQRLVVYVTMSGEEKLAAQRRLLLPGGAKPEPAGPPAPADDPEEAPEPQVRPAPDSERAAADPDEGLQRLPRLHGYLPPPPPILN